MKLEGLSEAFKALFFESYIDQVMEYQNLQAHGDNQPQIEEEKKEPSFQSTVMYTDKPQTFDVLTRAFVTCP